MADIEFMVRVKLPNANGYAACPSGDTDYERDYQRALAAAKPEGFEIRYPRANNQWAKDSEGFTLVPLYLTTLADNANHSRLVHWIDAHDCISKELQTLKDNLRKLLK